MYDYFRRWSRHGVWSQVLERLTQRPRRLNGQAARPSTGGVDGLKQVLTCLGASGASRLRKLWGDGVIKTRRSERGWLTKKRRTKFAWLMNFRRHARDYEVLTHHREALIQIAMIHLLIKRMQEKNGVFRQLLTVESAKRKYEKSYEIIRKIV